MPDDPRRPPVSILCHGTSSANLYIRSPNLTPHDAEGLSKIFSHKYNHRFEPERPGAFVDTSPEYYAKKMVKWQEMADNHQADFCIIALEVRDDEGHATDEDEIIGFGGYNALEERPNVDGDGIVRVANIGVMLHEPYTGKGYGYAALSTTIQAAFDLYGVDIVEAETLAINTPFRGLMKKLKLAKFEKLRFDNGLEDVLFAFTKSDWENLHGDDFKSGRSSGLNAI